MKSVLRIKYYIAPVGIFQRIPRVINVRIQEHINALNRNVLVSAVLQHQHEIESENFRQISISECSRKDITHEVAKWILTTILVRIEMVSLIIQFENEPRPIGENHTQSLEK
ncbi:hypothetical protein WA026_004577 [Henosepilachna vigintioctopunctata]|uniref:Uncharacterized protein n=1 Tax=Henosepilachna vigintioctopunctata TaxID=420089 RepID=A0AAW1V993_9CUCU